MKKLFILVFIVGCGQKEQKPLPLPLPIADTYFDSLYYGLIINHKKTELKVKADTTSDHKDRFYISYVDERVADINLATIKQREALRLKLAAVDGVIKARVHNRTEYILWISRHDWNSNKEQICDLFVIP